MSDSTTAPVAMSFYPNASSEGTKSLPLIAHENHFLGDVSTSSDPDKPISAGFYRLQPGPALTYTYTYHEQKIVLEGTIRVADEAGNVHEAKAGDVLYFPKGSTITFSTEGGALAFFVGQRAKGAI
ncbi:hypothetical protein EJ06DRAFT_526547 [Trichodelitschia bisporula]|uniref:(S)-ureidoglycine aminohydrolase cupin domain-containing protein n=1 Tax=Trichodelitschia bisporula TaxID=703511 RepID=A0A6G1I837_9PEZI|nr:hypothetical protein EJ06DRAFT_526547 [Trichodelitschia bisporula]